VAGIPLLVATFTAASLAVRLVRWSDVTLLVATLRPSRRGGGPA
jgi:hypothetical protein